MSDDQTYHGVDRRQTPACPCRYIVELSAKHEGDITLLKQALHFSETSLRAESAQVVADVKESALRIKECLMSMQESALMFKDGQARFSTVEHDITEVQQVFDDLEKTAGMPLNTLLILALRDREAAKWCVLGASAWLTALTIIVVTTGHWHQFLKVLEFIGTAKG